MKKIYLSFILFLTFVDLFSQVPATYYNSAVGLTGTALKQELHDIISSEHTPVSYTPGVWDAFATTDVFPSTTTIWDMYSDIPSGTPAYTFTLTSDQCGTYAGEGDCYNREHSFPKSWFGGSETSTMGTDLNHVVATDGYVNGRRSNYPFGVVNSPTWTSTNGSKLGANAYPGGFSGTAFEPIDEYKGDFARIYFYMATRYKDEIPGWVSSYGSTTEIDQVFQSDGNFLPAYYEMLYAWHTADPVSQKELDRDNAVYDVQGNANPYITHPEWVCEVFGSGCVAGPSLTVLPSSLSGFSYVEGAGPSVSQSFNLSGSLLDGSQVTVTADAEYEISLNNSVFSSSVNINYTAPDLASTTIYVRLKAGLLAASYNSRLVTCNDNGTASDKSVSLSGTVSSSGTGGTQICEDFDDQTGNAYLTTFTTDDFGTWTADNAGNFDLGTPRSGVSCVAINDDIAGAHITTPSFNTVGNVSFWYYQRSGDADDQFLFQISENGGSFVTLQTQNYVVGEVYTEFSYDVNSSSSDVKIRVVNDNQAAHLIIDDFCVSSFSPTSCTVPLTQASNVSFTSVTSASFTANWDRGLTPGENVIVLAKEGSAVDANPVDGTAYTANASFGSGSEIGTGNFVVFAGNASSVNIYGLSANTNYYLKIYEYNCTGTNSVYNTDLPAEGNQITAQLPVISLVGTLSDFGNLCSGSVSSEQNYTVSGTNLTDDLTVDAPAGFEVSVSSGSGFSSSLLLSPVSGTLSPTTVYVRFAPAGSGVFSENILHSSAGASSVNQAVSATGQSIPSVSTSSTSSITLNSANSGGNVSSVNNSALSGKGVCWNLSGTPLVSDFTTDDIAQGTGTGTYTSSVTGLNSSTLYYIRAYATNSCGTAYGNELSFTTLSDNPSTSFQIIDDYDATDFRTYNTDGTGTSYWNRNSVTEKYEAYTGSLSTPEHSFASFDLSTVFPSWELNKLSGNAWCGWIDLNRTSVSGWGADNYSCGFVLAANSNDFNNAGVQGYAIGFKNTGDALVLYKFNNGIKSGDTELPSGATEILDFGYDYVDANNGVNFYVEYLPDGKWKVYYLAGAALSASAATDKLNYTGGNASSVSTDETYSGTAYKYSGWIYAHSSGSSEKSYFDNFGAGMASCEVPTTDASLLNFSSITENSADVNWTSGNGSNRIVVAKKDNPVDWIPSDLTTYSANSVFDSGTDLGNGNFVVYNGNSNTFNLTGLQGASQYYFKIFEYNCSAGSELYFTGGTPAQGNFTTIPAPATDLSIVCTNNSTAEISWTSPSGNYTGVVIGFRNDSNPCHSLSSEASTLSSDSYFGLGTQYGTTTPYSFVVYKGTGNSVTVTGLTQGQQYQLKAYTYLNENSTVWSTETPELTINSLGVSNVTNAKALAHNTAVKLSWQNPANCYDEILVVAKYNSAVTAIPSGDGTQYTSNSIFGSGTLFETDAYVVYKGNGTDVYVSGLTNDQTYYFKIFVRKGNDWSEGTEISKMPKDITYFEAGELVFVGYDTKTSGFDCTDADIAIDVFYILTMVDIKPGTEFGFLNASYEYGAAANQRTDKFLSCSSTPGTYTPGRISVVWNGVSAISAGSVITVYLTSTSNANYFEVNGINQTSNFSSTGSFTNIAETSADQIWLYQGQINDFGVSPDIYSTIDGKIIFGLSNQADWVPFTSPVSVARTSRNHPDIECLNMDFSGDIPVNYYLTSASHIGTKREILLSLMNGANWTTSVNTDCNDIPSSVGTTAFTVNSSGINGTWRGDSDLDWFNCGNWESLVVPDAETDVLISSVAVNNAKIDFNSAFAQKFKYKAECKNLTIDAKILDLSGSNSDTLYVNGNVTNINGGIIDMDDSLPALDGVILLEGNWVNNSVLEEGDGKIVFKGSESQSISSTVSGTETFNYLTLKNVFAQGITLNSNIIVTDTFNNSSILNLNGNSIELQGVYLSNLGKFTGNSLSDFTVNNSGSVSDIEFYANTNVNNFTFDRIGENVKLISDLYISNNLTVSKGSVSLAASKNFDVLGDIINNAGNSGLILESDSTGTASLIHSTVGVAAQSERFFFKNAWHLFFSPLSSASSVDIKSTGNLLYYNEKAQDYWDIAQLYGTSGWEKETADALSDVKGYAKYLYSDTTYLLSGGTLFAGQKDFSVSYTNSGTGPVNENGVTADWDDFEGWNLIGNPFASGFDWDNPTIDKSNIENVVYYYDPSVSNYRYYGGSTPYNQGITLNGGSQIIPTNQAFFVKATNSGIFSIPNSARAHSVQDFYKSTTTTDKYVKLSIEKNNFSDETVIRVADNASENFDKNLDAFKLFSLDKTKPQIYSFNSSNFRKYSINSINSTTENTVIPIALYISEPGNFTVKFLENYFDTVHVIFEDKYLQKTLNISSESKYDFTSSEGNITDRFLIKFAPNNSPLLNYGISDQTIFAGDYYEFIIPENIFTDNDLGDLLKISVSENLEKSLPDWLNFSSETNTVSGTPQTEQIVNLKVTAVDLLGKSVSDTFKLTVLPKISTVENSENDNFKVFPNPADDYLYINSPVLNDKTVLKITDITGKILLKQKIVSTEQKIETKSLPEGIYLIEIFDGYTTHNFKTVIK